MKKVFSLVLARSVIATIGLTTTMGVGALSFEYDYQNEFSDNFDYSNNVIETNK